MKPLKHRVLCIKLLLLIFLPAVLKAQNSQTVNSGSQTAAASFPAGTCIYNWTNDSPSIGLATNGTGDIASFTAINNGSTPIIANITATPVATGYAYIPNSLSGTLSVVNTNTRAVTTVIPMLPDPVGVVVSPDATRVYVTHSTQNSISLINTATNTVTSVIQGAIVPYGIAITPDGNYIYVANSGTSNIWKISTASFPSSVLSINVGHGPVGVVVSADGSKVYAANYNDGTVSVVSTATNAVLATIPIGIYPYFITITPDGSQVYVSHRNSNTISVIKTSDNSFQTVNVGNTPNGITVSPEGSRVYVANSGSNTVSVISTASNTVTNTIPVGNYPVGVSVSSDGGLLYVTNNNAAGTVSIINTVNFAVASPINVGSYPFSVGNFVTAGAPCGSPVTFTITVNPANVTPVITTNGTPLAVSTTFGTASAPATFMAGVSNATGNLVVSAPAGFEVSLDGIIYFNVVTMNGPGNITPRLVYIRLKSTTPVSTYFGSIVLTSPGATTVNVPMPLSTVTAPTPLITVTGTPSALSTTYGAPSSSTSFSVSGVNLVNPLTITPPAGFEVSTDGINFSPAITIATANANVANTIYIRLKQTTAAGTYSGPIVLRSTGAADVNVAMPASTVSPASLIVIVQGSKIYGDTFSNFVATTANFDFKDLNSGLQNGETVASLAIAFTGGNNATDPVGAYTNAIHTLNITGANGFLLSNYNVTYPTGTLTVTTAPLIIIANNVSKTFGNTLIGGTGSTAFTVTGLQNSETVNSVTIAYGNGAAANALTGVYNGSVVPSAAVGGNGFLTGNYAITYTSGTLTVIPAGPSITASGTLQPLTTVYGTASSSASFTVSGSNLTAGILVTPPAGFEVSLDNFAFSNTVTVGSAGTFPSTPVYIRLKQTAFVGSYSGNITLKSPGATDGVETMPPGTVTPAPLAITANDVVKTYGNILTGGAGSTAFKISGLQNSETVNNVTITYGTGAGAIANAGTYNASITPSAATGGTFTPGNYTPTYHAGNITVNPVPLIATADNKSKIYEDANPALTITYTGFVNSDGIPQLTTQPVAVTTATITSPVGQYLITVSGGVAPNYTFAYVNGILTIKPVPSAKIIIPNTFTPNGDGINDTWDINNLNIHSNITVEIMNRYGTRVYFSNNYSAPWDGKYNGAKVPNGTYYYIITGINNKPLTGYVAVIR